jgi:hypothetical protein
MSGSIENQTPGASERSGASDRVLTWHASRAMLPLVGRIAQDVAGLHAKLGRLRPELAQLERGRLQLDWPKRQRRYQLEQEVQATEADLRSAVAELDALGVALLDEAEGLVGFPTLVNERRAYFSWRPGEEVLGFWSYAGDSARHAVPEEWALPRRERGRARPRRR